MLLQTVSYGSRFSIEEIEMGRHGLHRRSHAVRSSRGRTLHPLLWLVLLSMQSALAAHAPCCTPCPSGMERRPSRGVTVSTRSSPDAHRLAARLSLRMGQGDRKGLRGRSRRRQLAAKADSESPLICPCCASEMKLIAVITNPSEVGTILRHLIKIGRAPPGLDPSSLN